MHTKYPESGDIAFASLRPLAQLAMRQTGADGFILYAIDSGSGACVEKCSGGRASINTSPAGAIVAFPLRANGQVTGRIVFGFPGAQIPLGAQRALDKIVTGIEAIWNLLERQERYTALAVRMGRLEAELADSKIAGRVRGLLESADAEPDALSTAARHIESVLRAQQPLGTLQNLVETLEEELVARQLAGQAKDLLQRSYGMSEEAAYRHLWLTSRRSRKPLQEVARELIEAGR